MHIHNYVKVSWRSGWGEGRGKREEGGSGLIGIAYNHVAVDRSYTFDKGQTMM